VGDSGFEPLTSSASKKYDTLLEVSATCKIAANQRICALAHFPAFQEIHSGCCTVAAQVGDGRQVASALESSGTMQHEP
jgi:hypothetical protein